jgi:hypothetical protein
MERKLAQHMGRRFGSADGFDGGAAVMDRACVIYWCCGWGWASTVLAGFVVV